MVATMHTMSLLLVLAAVDPSAAPASATPQGVEKLLGAPEIGSAAGSVVGWSLVLLSFATGVVNGSGPLVPGVFVIIGVPFLCAGAGGLVGAIIAGDLLGAALGAPAAAIGTVAAGAVAATVVFVAAYAGDLIALQFGAPQIAGFAIGGVAGGAVALVQLAVIPAAAYAVASELSHTAFAE